MFIFEFSMKALFAPPSSYFAAFSWINLFYRPLLSASKAKPKSKQHVQHVNRLVSGCLRLGSINYLACMYCDYIVMIF